MGWVLVNVVIPLTLPLCFLMLLKLAELPQPYRDQSRLARAVRDGQLGWVSMGFSASTTYDLVQFLFDAGKIAPEWAGPACGASITFVVMSSVLPIIGTLFPYDDSRPRPTSLRRWVREYRLLIGTVLLAILAGSLFALVHFKLSVTIR